MALNAKHVKVSGSSAGRTGRKKTDGYAATRPSDAVVGTKVGVTNKEGYSGPNVAQGSLKG